MFTLELLEPSNIVFIAIVFSEIIARRWNSLHIYLELVNIYVDERCIGIIYIDNYSAGIYTAILISLAL